MLVNALYLAKNKNDFYRICFNYKKTKPIQKVNGYLIYKSEINEDYIILVHYYNNLIIDKIFDDFEIKNIIENIKID